MDATDVVQESFENVEGIRIEEQLPRPRFLVVRIRHSYGRVAA
ncbi:hypothetical protein [Rhodococcus sp. HM1]|nr:hypothetical protein [Rhodococcus sp. HM1]